MDGWGELCCDACRQLWVWRGELRSVQLRFGSCGVVWLVRYGCVKAVGVSCDMLLWGAIRSDKFGYVKAVEFCYLGERCD